jgi:hypothetical protein
VTALPTLTILIPTLGQRETVLRRLLGILLPQTEPHNGRVQVMGWFNNGQPSLGEIRDGLVDASTTDYVTFVDDDDVVPGYYVQEVLRGLEHWPDKLGFPVELYVRNRLQETCDQSLRHTGWYRDARGVLCRDVVHIAPVRREIAAAGRFAVAAAGQAEDIAWVEQVRPLLHSEHYLPAVMYHYLYSPRSSAWRAPASITRGHPRPTVDHPHFRWHPASDP